MPKINRIRLSLILFFSLVHMNTFSSNIMFRETVMPDELKELLPKYDEYKVASEEANRALNTTLKMLKKFTLLHNTCGTKYPYDIQNSAHNAQIYCDIYKLHKLTAEKLRASIEFGEKDIEETEALKNTYFIRTTSPREQYVKAAKLLLKYRISQNKTGSRADAGTE